MLITDFLQSNNLQFQILESGEDYLHLSFEIVAKPGSKLQKINISADGRLQVFVSARAIEGAANKAIIKYLSKSLGISQGQIEFISGEKSKQKRIAIYYSFSEHKPVSIFLQKWETTLK